MSELDPVDLELFRTGRREMTTAGRRRGHRSDHFIVVKEPWSLLVRIAGLPGHALIVYLHLRRLWTMSGRRIVTELRWGPLRVCPVSARTLRRGLKALERAGIVVVHQKTGRKSTFTFTATSDRLGRTEGIIEKASPGSSTMTSPGDTEGEL